MLSRVSYTFALYVRQAHFAKRAYRAAKESSSLGALHYLELSPDSTADSPKPPYRPRPPSTLYPHLCARFSTQLIAKSHSPPSFCKPSRSLSKLPLGGPAASASRNQLGQFHYYESSAAIAAPPVRGHRLTSSRLFFLSRTASLLRHICYRKLGSTARSQSILPCRTNPPPLRFSHSAGILPSLLESPVVSGIIGPVQSVSEVPALRYTESNSFFIWNSILPPQSAEGPTVWWPWT